VEKLGRLAFEGMADELKEPSQHKQCECHPPEAVTNKASGEYRHRDQDGRNAVGMTNAIDRMLMAAFVLCDPPVAGLSAQHTADDHTRGCNRFTREAGIRKQLFRQSGLLQFLLTELSLPQLSVLIFSYVFYFFRESRGRNLHFVASGGQEVVPLQGTSSAGLPRRAGRKMSLHSVLRKIVKFALARPEILILRTVSYWVIVRMFRVGLLCVRRISFEAMTLVSQHSEYSAKFVYSIRVSRLRRALPAW
jgi:hypothetical protein